jgi:hypothetical protein
LGISVLLGEKLFEFAERVIGLRVPAVASQFIAIAAAVRAKPLAARPAKGSLGNQSFHFLAQLLADRQFIFRKKNDVRARVVQVFPAPRAGIFRRPLKLEHEVGLNR